MRSGTMRWGLLGLSSVVMMPGACTVERHPRDGLGSAGDGGTTANQGGSAGAVNSGDAGAAGLAMAGSGGQGEGGSVSAAEGGATTQGGSAGQANSSMQAAGSAGEGGYGGAPAISVCGDGVVAESEPCDDGNAINTDACTNQCICGVGLTGSHCELNRFVVLTPSSVTLDSVAYDTNADGTVVTGQQASSLFVWTQASGSVVPNFGLRISSSSGRAINADGTVIVGQAVLNADSAPQQAFRWSLSTGIVALNANSTPHEDVRDVSADGAVVVGYTDRFGTETVPFRWTSAGGITQLAVPTGGSAAQVVRLSGDGATSIGYAKDANNHFVPVRWAGSAPGQAYAVPLEYDAGRFFAATSDGTTLFGSYDVVSTTTAFRWTQTNGPQILMQSALKLKGLADVSADGSVLVGNCEAGAFVWKLPAGQPEMLATLLEAQGASLSGLLLSATAVSGDGNVIVGYATASSSNLKVAFLARWR